jgi:alkylhydroperoxidase/carboxymuconolactone decarboxylase family protein YurZ
LRWLSDISDKPHTVQMMEFARLTNDVVFNGLWRRPDLSLHDRSLATIAALAAAGDDDQLVSRCASGSRAVLLVLRSPRL